MSHGESQEKGQEESQEEVILWPWSIRRARNFLARRFKFKDRARYQAGSVVSGSRPFRSDAMSAQMTGKQAAAHAALEFVEQGKVLGVGTGSTVNFLIDALATHRLRIPGAVSSSRGTSERLEAAGIAVLDLNEVGAIETYIDGADETNHQRQ